MRHLVLALSALAALASGTSAQAHQVCDAWGRCWEQPDPGEAIVGGVIHELIPHHHHDWDHHDWDHGYYYHHHHHHHHHHDEEDDDE